MRTTLIAICLQEDFLPGGRLWLNGLPEEGTEILQKISTLAEKADVTVFTKSIHSPHHYSFATFLPHCVGGTRGARLNPQVLESAEFHHVATNRVGNDPPDVYSAFDAGTLRPKESLEEILKREQTDEVWIAGLGHEWEVPQTAFDANALGYRTTIWTEAIRDITDFTYAKLTNAGVVINPS